MGSGDNKTALVPIVVAAALAIFFAVAHTPLEPTRWANPPPLRLMEAALTPNDALLETVHLHEGDVIAPEAFVIGQDDTIYTGLWDGRVIALDSQGENPKSVFFTGGFVAAAGRAVESKNGLDYQSKLLTTCQQLARDKELSPEDEAACGRPLGLRLQDKMLYILDAYHGLFVMDLSPGGYAKQLVNSLTDLPSAMGKPAGGVAPEVEKPMRFLNDLDISETGVIFMTDSSWKHPRVANRAEVIDGSPRGRLIRFNEKTGELHTAVCGLHFPNGVEIDQSGSKLLVAESMRFRVLEIDLKALQTGAATALSETLVESLSFCGEREELPPGVGVFADNLPGFIDNFNFDDALGGYVAGLGTKVSKPFSLLYSALAAHPWLRVGITKVLSMKLVEKLAPKYGLVIVLGLDGTIKSSFHDPTARTPFISTAIRHPASGYTFLGSSQNFYLGRVTLG